VQRKENLNRKMDMLSSVSFELLDIILFRPQSVNQSCIFRMVQVTKSLQDPLEVANNLPEISDNVRE